MSSLKLHQLSTAPNAPAASTALLYIDSNGILHVLSSDGTDTELGSGKVKTSLSDTTANYLYSKIYSGDGISVGETGIPGEGKVRITALGTVRVSNGQIGPSAFQKYLSDLIAEGNGISITKINAGTENEQLEISSTFQAIVGEIKMWPTNTPPSGWILCYGQLLDNTTYASLLNVFVADINDLGLGAGTTCTADDTTDTITATSHGLNNNDVVLFSNSGGTLPGGLSSNTIYYVVSATTDTFKVSTSQGGSAVDITSVGSGTHYFHTQFRNIDMRGRMPLGKDNMGGTSAGRVTNAEADKIAGSSGEETHTLTVNEMPSHSHDLYMDANVGGNYTYPVANNTNSLRGTSTVSMSSVGGDGAHNNMPPFLTLNFIIYSGV
jgi:microcystin-dependent protein